jgi:hypothetical protein
LIIVTVSGFDFVLSPTPGTGDYVPGAAAAAIPNENKDSTGEGKEDAKKVSSTGDNQKKRHRRSSSRGGHFDGNKGKRSRGRKLNRAIPSVSKTGSVADGKIDADNNCLYSSDVVNDTNDDKCSGKNKKGRRHHSNHHKHRGHNGKRKRKIKNAEKAADAAPSA